MYTGTCNYGLHIIFPAGTDNECVEAAEYILSYRITKLYKEMVEAFGIMFPEATVQSRVD